MKEIKTKSLKLGYLTFRDLPDIQNPISGVRISADREYLTDIQLISRYWVWVLEYVSSDPYLSSNNSTANVQEKEREREREIFCASFLPPYLMDIPWVNINNASFVMLYHIPDLEPNWKQKIKICLVVKGLNISIHNKKYFIIFFSYFHIINKLYFFIIMYRFI